MLVTPHQRCYSLHKSVPSYNPSGPSQRKVAGGKLSAELQIVQGSLRGQKKNPQIYFFGGF
jgi:hypothetical protein